MAKAVRNKQSKSRKPADAAKQTRANGKQAKQGGQSKPAVKEQAKAPNRWSRVRSAVRRPTGGRSAARPQGARKERSGPRKFFHDVRVEMGKVTWPTRKDLIQSTIVVIVAVIIMSAYTGALDFVFSRIVEGLLDLIGA